MVLRRSDEMRDAVIGDVRVTTFSKVFTRLLGDKREGGGRSDYNTVC